MYSYEERMRAGTWLCRESANPIMPNRFEAIRQAAHLEVDAISLGASYNVDIRYEQLGLSYVPLWLPASDLFETATFFDQLLGKGLQPDYAIIVLDAYQFYQDNGTPAGWDVLHPVTRDPAYALVHEMSPFELIGGDVTGWLWSMFTPPQISGAAPRSSQVWKAIKGLLDPPDNSPYARYDFHQVPDPAAPAHVRAVSDFLSNILIHTVEANPKIIDRTMPELRRIALLARTHDIQLVVVAGVPLLRQYEDALTKAISDAGLDKIIRPEDALAQATELLREEGATVIPLVTVWDRNKDGAQTE